MVLTVEELLDVPYWDRKPIMLGSKPRPVLSQLAVAVGNDYGGMEVQRFDPAMYDTFPWLTGSEVYQSFYCWPCLLFGSREKLWKVSDLAHLSESIQVHEKTRDHTQAATHLQNFVKGQAKLKPGGQQPIHTFRKNRDILKLLIDVVCEVAKEVPFRGHRESESQVNPRSCEKLLDLMQRYSDQNGRYSDEAIEWIKLRPTLLNDLVDSINKVIQLRFKAEIGSSTYVSFILSEHSPDPTRPQISLVARYVRNGKVHERFLGFTNLAKRNDHHLIFNLISVLIQHYGISQQFLAYSLDGAVLDTDELLEFVSKFPDSYFVPSYFHGLYDVLQQSLSTDKDAGLFFKTMTAMDIFFRRNSNRWMHFEQFLLVKIPALRGAEIWKDVQSLQLVFRYRTHFIEYLDSVSQSCSGSNAGEVVQAVGFRQFLTEFQTVFLLHVTCEFFQTVAPFANALKRPDPELSFEFTYSILHHIYTSCKDFENFWDAATEEYRNSDEQSAKRLETDYCHQKDHYNLMFANVAGRFHQEMKIRCRYLAPQLEFCCLLQKEHRSCDDTTPTANIFLKKSSSYYLSLMKEHQKSFYNERLLSELQVLRSMSTTFEDKNIYDILEYVTESGIKDGFQQFTKLMEFTLSMPFKQLSNDGNTTKFENIKKMRYSVTSVLKLGDISVLSVESDFLSYLKSEDSLFYSDVIDAFYQVNKSVELLDTNLDN